MAIKGSCLCGEVTYTIDNTPDRLSHCHCSMCRRMHGGAFVTFAQVKVADFRFVNGVERIRYYQSSPNVKRSFCEQCGAKFTFEMDQAKDLIWVACGTLDDDPGIRPEAHIFVGSKAPWYTICDELPQHDAYPA